MPLDAYRNPVISKTCLLSLDNQDHSHTGKPDHDVDQAADEVLVRACGGRRLIYVDRNPPRQLSVFEHSGYSKLAWELWAPDMG